MEAGLSDSATVSPSLEASGARRGREHCRHSWLSSASPLASSGEEPGAGAVRRGVPVAGGGCTHRNKGTQMWGEH